jgi:hypothetical protein
MLGVAMSTLQEHPILNNVHIPDTTVNSVRIPGFDADSDLADFLNSFEQIKITLVPTNVEELSKIWATINQPYRLSVAYEVSIVDLTPTTPPPVNGGIVSATNLDLITLESPRISALSPIAGPLAHIDGAGNLQPNDLTISGVGLVSNGQNASVHVGGQSATVKPAPPPSNNLLVATLPSSFHAGPQEDVRVTLSGRTSTPFAFTVSPWLERITPIRTALDAPPTNLVLNGVGFSGSPGAVRFDGPGGVQNLTVFNVASDTEISLVLPPTLANGLYNVQVVLNDALSGVSNSRILEVIPRLDAPIGLAVMTVSNTQIHQLTLNGARLSGTDVRVSIDGAGYSVDPSTITNATQLVLTLKRLLPAGPHSVWVSVNGQTSHKVALQV